MLIKEIIVSCEKPDTHVFDLYMLGINKENDLYYVWKVKNVNGKKMKMVYLKGVFSFIGKTIGHTYEVTYYKHSKVIVDVKKIKQKENTRGRLAGTQGDGQRESPPYIEIIFLKTQYLDSETFICCV